VDQLGAADLTADCRVAVEKPFGTSLDTAIELNERLHRVLREDQILRIDHYLGKEPVQDIEYVRFSNAWLEPLWRREYVESIQITMAEDFGVEDRGSFYDRVGTLRDVVQNHLLQVLALVLMEPPGASDDPIGDRRLDVFRAIRPLAADDVVRGQYEGYRAIPGVAGDSDTETYVAVRLHCDTWRWAGVPIIIRAGKRMPITSTEVVVRLKKAPAFRLGDRMQRVTGHDDVVLRIGKPSGIDIGIRVKTPGVDAVERLRRHAGRVPQSLRAAAPRRDGRRPHALPALGLRGGHVGDRAAGPRQPPAGDRLRARDMGPDGGRSVRAQSRWLARSAPDDVVACDPSEISP
jgi:glucose-6-phosphate 1-dehydrogenase